MREKGARFACDGWCYVITKGFERFLIVVLSCWEVSDHLGSDIWEGTDAVPGTTEGHNPCIKTYHNQHGWRRREENLEWEGVVGSLTSATIGEM